MFYDPFGVGEDTEEEHKKITEGRSTSEALGLGQMIALLATNLIMKLFVWM